MLARSPITTGAVGDPSVMVHNFGPPVMLIRSLTSTRTEPGAAGPMVTLAVGMQLMTCPSMGIGPQMTAAAGAAERTTNPIAGTIAATRVRNQRVARERLWLTTCSLLSYHWCGVRWRSEIASVMPNGRRKPSGVG